MNLNVELLAAFRPDFLVVGVVIACAIAAASIAMSLWLIFRYRIEFSTMLLSSPYLYFAVLTYFSVCVVLIATMSFLGVLVSMLLGMICIMISVRSLAARKRALLEVLSISVEKQIPLPTLAAAYARDQGGVYGRRLRRWAEILKVGTPLSIAIEHSRGVLPREARMGVRIGQISGDLAGGLRAAQMRRILDEPMWHAMVARLLYLGWLTLVVLPSIGTFLAVKIAPSFVKIFHDFHVQLPMFSTQVIGFLSSGGVHAILMLLTISDWGVMLLLTLHYVGGLPDGFPVIARLTRRLDTAVILRALALSAARNRPLGPMLYALGDSYPKQAIREKLQLVQNDIEAGQRWFESLQRRGIISRADAGLLSSAERLGNLAWALTEVADSNERRLSYQLTAVTQVIVPITVIGVGMLVAYFAIAYFLPLVKLITALS